MKVSYRTALKNIKIIIKTIENILLSLWVFSYYFGFIYSI